MDTFGVAVALGVIVNTLRKSPEVASIHVRTCKCVTIFRWPRQLKLARSLPHGRASRYVKTEIPREKRNRILTGFFWPSRREACVATQPCDPVQCRAMTCLVVEPQCYARRQTLSPSRFAQELEELRNTVGEIVQVAEGLFQGVLAPIVLFRFFRGGRRRRGRRWGRRSRRAGCRRWRRPAASCPSSSRASDSRTAALLARGTCLCG